MTRENGKEQKQKAPPENPVAWVAELEPDVLAGLLFGLAQRYDDDKKKKGDDIKVLLPGALVRTVEQFTTFLAKENHPGMGNPVEFLTQAVLMSQAMILAKMKTEGKLSQDRSPLMAMIESMVEGVAKDVAERGKDLPPEEFAALLRQTLEEIGLDPNRVSVCTEANGELDCSGCSRDPATCPVPKMAKAGVSSKDGLVQIVAVPRPESDKADDGDPDGLPSAPPDRPGAS